jgi:Flp pilus assembly protein TadB
MEYVWKLITPGLFQKRRFQKRSSGVWRDRVCAVIAIVIVVVVVIVIVTVIVIVIVVVVVIVIVTVIVIVIVVASESEHSTAGNVEITPA